MPSSGRDLPPPGKDAGRLWARRSCVVNWRGCGADRRGSQQSGVHAFDAVEAGGVSGSPTRCDHAESYEEAITLGRELSKNHAEAFRAQLVPLFRQHPEGFGIWMLQMLSDYRESVHEAGREMTLELEACWERISRAQS